jgi:uncharacterized protein (DUF433 family)
VNNRLIVIILVYNFPGIEKKPKVAGGSACIIRTRIPVLTLESLRRFGKTEAEILFDFPTLKAIDPVNAWSYINANIEEINKEKDRMKKVIINHLNYMFHPLMIRM